MRVNREDSRDFFENQKESMFFGTTGEGKILRVAQNDTRNVQDNMAAWTNPAVHGKIRNRKTI